MAHGVPLPRDPSSPNAMPLRLDRWEQLLGRLRGPRMRSINCSLGPASAHSNRWFLARFKSLLTVRRQEAAAASTGPPSSSIRGRYLPRPRRHQRTRSPPDASCALKAMALPRANEAPAATMPLTPSMPTAMSATCIEPPRPPQIPAAGGFFVALGGTQNSRPDYECGLCSARDVAGCDHVSVASVATRHKETVAWLDLFLSSIAPHAGHPLLVYLGSTNSTGMPARRALCATNVCNCPNDPLPSRARWGCWP